MTDFWDRARYHFAKDNPGFRRMFGLTAETPERIEAEATIERQKAQVRHLQTVPQGRLVFNVLDEQVRRNILFDFSGPNLFARLIGNEEAKEVVAWSIFAALGREDHVLAENFLLAGPASSGKTMFARLIAETLGLPFIEVAASTLAKQRQPLEYLLDKIIEVCANFKPDANLNLYHPRVEDADDLTLRPRMLNYDPQLESGNYCFNQFSLPPMVVFIDEAHALPSALEQALLKVTERGDAFMTTETDSTADCSKVCWILATTERGKLFKPFDTRFEKVNLRLYTKDEIAEIISKIDEFKDWDGDTCRLVAHYCNRIPREAISFARKVQQAMVATPGKLEDVAARVAERKGIDPFGMTYQRLEILRVLGQRPASINALCAAVGCEDEELRRFILPWLIASTPDQEPYVIVTNRHYITPAGLAELDKRDIEHRPAKDILTKADFAAYLDSRYKAVSRFYAAFVKDSKTTEEIPGVEKALSDPKNIENLRRAGKILAAEHPEKDKVKTMMKWIEEYLDWRGV